MPRVLQNEFLVEIAAHPHDDAPRLVFADWLDDQADPYGEFIRVQCELAKTSPDDPKWTPLKQRETELYDAHHEEWELPLLRLGVSDWRFERGFLESVTVPIWRDFAPVNSLFQIAPTIREVKFQGKGIGRYFKALLQAEFFKNLDRLDLSRCHLGSERIQALASSPRLKNLKALDLRENSLDGRGFNAIMTSKTLSSLESLNLDGNDSFDTDFDSLAESELLPRLEELHLGRIELNDVGLASFVNCISFGSLRSLCLSHNLFDSEGIRYFARNFDAPKLVCLNLRGNTIGDDGIDALANSPWVSSLRHLNAASCEFTLDGLRAITDSPHFENLISLSIARMGIHLSYRWQPFFEYLLEEPWFDRLELLDVRRNLNETIDERLRERFEGRLMTTGDFGWMPDYRSLV